MVVKKDGSRVPFDRENILRGVRAACGKRPISEDQKEDLVAFMVALTDSRVKYRRAPFDHPELTIPNGGSVSSEESIHLQEVGSDGAAVPLETFLGIDPQVRIRSVPEDACNELFPKEE